MHRSVSVHLIQDAQIQDDTFVHLESSSASDLERV